MDTPESTAGETRIASEQSETGSASPCCDGLPPESRRRTQRVSRTRKAAERFAGRPRGIGDDKFDLCDSDILYAAVFVTLHHYETSGLEPGAERWQADTRWFRPQLVGDIRSTWLELLGRNSPPLFPFHDDYVVDCFVSLRKVNEEKKRACCAFFGLPIPLGWSRSCTMEESC